MSGGFTGDETTAVDTTQSTDSALVWHKLHPVTPLVRGWSVLAVAILVIGQMSFDIFDHDNDGGNDGFRLLDNLGLVALALVAVAIVVFVGMWLSWRFTSYAISADEVHLRRGIVFRQQRHARLDRIQAIDIRSPLVARIFGLSELRVESAGGADSAIAIGFLRDADAGALRADLLARAAAKTARAAGAVSVQGDVSAAGVSTLGLAEGSPLVAGSEAGGVVAQGGLATPAPEQEMYAVDPKTLIGSLLRSPSLWLVVALLAVIVALVVVFRQPAIFASVLPMAIAFGSLLWSRFAGEFNFKATQAPEGIRISRGLLETRAQTIPTGRVQAVSLTQPFLWRGKDWWRVRVNVAGYQVSASETDGTNQARSVLLPVGSRAEALTAMWLVLPELGVENPLEVLDEGLTGIQPADGFTPAGRRFTNAPKRAWIVDPLAWRRDAYAVTDTALLLRRDRIIRRLDVVPHAKMQSINVEQGPLQRKLRVATFCVHSTPGMITPTVPHLDEHDAARLLDEQAARSLAARSAENPAA